MAGRRNTRATCIDQPRTAVETSLKPGFQKDQNVSFFSFLALMLAFPLQQVKTKYPLGTTQAQGCFLLFQSTLENAASFLFVRATVHVNDE